MKYKKLYTILSYWKYFPFLFNLMKYKKLMLLISYNYIIMAYNLLNKSWVGEQLRLGDGALVSSGQDVRIFLKINYLLMSRACTCE